jgi:geranylgeranyl diphosphate synthase, type II
MRSAEELRRLCEDALASLSFASELGELEEAVRYSLRGGGKRVRPVLCLATGESVGCEPEALLPAACAVELVHTFSLVHDDLPALDDDALRRGRPSAHVRFGEDVAILAGDALLAEAFRLALSYPSTEVARMLAEATLGMIGGQYADVTKDGTLDAERLATVHRLKTGRLLEGSVACALAVAAVPDDARAPWRAFAEELGLLFQIVDDILDASGDVEAERMSYVSLYGLEHTRELADAAHGRARDRLGALAVDTRVLGELVDWIRARAL